MAVVRLIQCKKQLKLSLNYRHHFYKEITDDTSHGDVRIFTWNS